MTTFAVHPPREQLHCQTSPVTLATQSVDEVPQVTRQSISMSLNVTPNQSETIVADTDADLPNDLTRRSDPRASPLLTSIPMINTLSSPNGGTRSPNTSTWPAGMHLRLLEKSNSSLLAIPMSAELTSNETVHTLMAARHQSSEAAKNSVMTPSNRDIPAYNSKVCRSLVLPQTLLNEGTVTQLMTTQQPSFEVATNTAKVLVNDISINDCNTAVPVVAQSVVNGMELSLQKTSKVTTEILPMAAQQPCEIGTNTDMELSHGDKAMGDSGAELTAVLFHRTSNCMDKLDTCVLTTKQSRHRNELQQSQRKSRKTRQTQSSCNVVAKKKKVKETWICGACSFTYGDQDDPLIGDDWFICNTCAGKFHESCGVRRGRKKIFYCHAC
jgi:hypothetical protein